MATTTIPGSFTESELRSEFFTRLLEARKLAGPPLALQIASTADTERHVFSGARPSLRRRIDFVAGPHREAIRHFGFSITNRLYETEVALPFQQYLTGSPDFVRQWVQNAADAAITLPDEIVADLLNSGFTTTGTGILHFENFTLNASGDYVRTGTVAYFSDAHAWYGSAGATATIDNNYALDLSIANLQTVWQGMTNVFDDRGHPLGVRPNVLVIRPEDEITAYQILQSQTYPLTTANTSAANFFRDGRLQVVINQYLTDADSFFLLDTTLNPLIIQQLEDVSVSFYSPQGQVGQADRTAQDADEVVAKVTWRGSGGYGWWMAAAGSAGAG